MTTPTAPAKRGLKIGPHEFSGPPTMKTHEGVAPCAIFGPPSSEIKRIAREMGIETGAWIGSATHYSTDHVFSGSPQWSPVTDDVRDWVAVPNHHAERFEDALSVQRITFKRVTPLCFHHEDSK